MQSSSRRDFLKNAGAVTLGLIATSGLAGTVLSCSQQTTEVTKTATSTSTYTVTVPQTVTVTSSVTPVSQTTTTSATQNSFDLSTLPWPYEKIDPAAAADRAYAAYSAGGCMYGGFEGIIGELRAKVGYPFDTFPTLMMKYGGGGVAGWGTLCGALNGTAAAINLLAPSTVVNKIISEVYGWYGTTQLPIYTPASSDITEIQTSVADSQLCHQSVTNWCNTSGFKSTSPERAERCARLTASVVQYTVNLLNQQVEGTFEASFTSPASVTGCLSCHGRGGFLENVHISNQTDCTTCHSELPSTHPG